MSQNNSLKEQICEAACQLKEKLGRRAPEIGIILGSGLGPLADQLQDAVVIPFNQISHMKSSTASGHKGRFVCGTLAGRVVLAMQGRLHGYEGYASAQVTFPIWVMNELGIQTLIVTNAVGAINETYAPGNFCVIRDHINFTGRNPLVGDEPNAIAERFSPMHDAYDPQLRKLALDTASRLGLTAHEGVYLGLLGPSFETPAEIKAFRIWGADTVAMSLVEEVIAARHVGIRVLGISLVSNMACGVKGAACNGDEVLEVAQSVESDFIRLITDLVGQI